MAVRMREFAPSLRVADATDGVRLTLDGITHASGPTLQDAADALVLKVLGIAMAFRSGCVASAPGLRIDPAVHDFIWEIAGIATSGGDIRDRLFGPRSTTAPESPSG